ncbi:MAG TPA: flagellar basal body P-ring formation chaperone FlgA [Phycisphaerae bacterium]|nr:flagellar basal body P-ring formation chaperone FlgA [Phycisphaerae bacterium]
MTGKDGRQIGQQQWEQQTLLRCVVMAAVLSLLLFALAEGAELRTGAEGDWLRIRLWPRSVIEGDRVVLGDAARLDGGSADQREAVAAMVLRASPSVGGHCSVTLEDVAERLSVAGLNPAEVLLGGATSCEVHRVGPPPGSAASQVRGSAAEVGRTLEDRIRQHIFERTRSIGGGIQIRFGAVSGSALGLCEPTYQFRIHQRSGEGLGLVSLEADVCREGEVLQKLPIVANVSAEVSVVVARRPINRGVEIKPEDVALEPRCFDRVEKVGLTDLSAAIGQQAVGFIDRGQTVCGRQLRAMPLVKRGDLVTVRLRQGYIEMESAGKALGSGCYGETIEVRAAGSKATFTAKVTGLRTVQVCGT